MRRSYGSSVKEACVLLDKFRAERRSLDDFIQDASNDLKDVETLQKKFILDVVSGCIERKKLLDVVVSAFYGQNRIWVSKNDHSQFDIICYLTIFALDELGLHNFSNIVKSLGINKMHLFLNFFFSNLTSWIQDEWNTIYDPDFVEREWIGALLRWRPKINTLMDQLAPKLSEGSQVKKAPSKTDQPQEFNLTRPKPRALPEPDLTPQQEKSKPVRVPKSTYTAQRKMQVTEEIRDKNHQKAETTSCSVKLNNATILRREALLHHQVEEELQRIEQLVQGARDPSTFLQRQQELLERDRQEKMPMNKQKCLEVRISEEKTVLARQQITERNQKAAQLKKEETAQLMQKYAEKRVQEEKELRDLVQQVASHHKNSKAAKEKLQKLKQNIVKEVSEQSQDLLRQALEEQQEQLWRKFQIIHEIHSIETLPRIRFNEFNDTETAGHELLEEMSLAELKERLALLKQSQQTEQEARRAQILEEKQKKKQEMEEKLEAIELHRRALAKEAAHRKEEKRAKQEYLQQLVEKDETVLALRKKLEEQKQESHKLKLSEKRKIKPRKQTSAHTGTHSQKSLKVKSWEEVEQDFQDTYDSSS